jgi:hypothetical protein
MAIVPIQKIFAYNTGAPIFGTTQVGDIAVSDIATQYSDNYGGVQWWGGPDETYGYVITHTDPTGSHNGEPGGPAYLGFWRSNGLTDQAFLDLCNSIPPRIGDTPFTNTSDASTWLYNNGYWTSFNSITPTPTATFATTPTPTSTSVSATPTPSVTHTSTPTGTPASTPTPTPTPTHTSVTPTPTPTSGASGNFNVSISQQGPNVVWNGSGSFNLAALTFDSTLSIGAGYGASQAIWAIGPSASVDTYSGTITYPPNFGTGGYGVTSTSGSTFGILPGGSGRVLYVPAGYTSNTTISGSATYTSQTISSMGLTPGTYTWSWGTGGNTSTLVMTITS